MLDDYNIVQFQYYSLTPECRWTSFEKRNNLDELNNIPTKAEGRSVIQISFRTQDPNIRQAQSASKNYGWSTIHWVFKIRKSTWFTTQIHNPCSFLRPDPPIRKPIHPPLPSITKHPVSQLWKTTYPGPERMISSRILLLISFVSHIPPRF